MPGWSRNRRHDLANEIAGTSGKAITQKPGIQPGFCILSQARPRPVATSAKYAPMRASLLG